MSTENVERACTSCQGKGTVFWKGFVIGDKIYPDEDKVCSSCNGSKVFPALDVKDVLTRIIAKQGKNKNRIRAAMVSPLRQEGVKAERAYYVWRLARYHGGKDVTMPVTADMIIRGDPFRDELDKMADEIAKLFFGTDMAAAMIWGRALGFSV